MANPDRSGKSTINWNVLWNDMYVDFLGSFVPGFLALFTTIIILFPSIFLFCLTLDIYTSGHHFESLPIYFNNIMTNPGVLKVMEIMSHVFSSSPFIFLFFVISYILGFIFYRQDPKKPDHRSAIYVWNNNSEKGDRQRLAVQPRSQEQDTITPSDAQFPYFFLYEYLSGRNLKHLAKLIPWRGSVVQGEKGKREEHWNRRTKMFINMIKIRLQFIMPDKCKDIIRNEAHVRLSTSVWYAARWLIYVSLCCFFLVVPSFFIFQKIGFFLYLLLFAIATVCALAIFIIKKIERFLHYLRVREIVYVLETASFALANGYESVMDDICFNPDDDVD